MYFTYSFHMTQTEVALTLQINYGSRRAKYSKKRKESSKKSFEYVKYILVQMQFGYQFR